MKKILFCDDDDTFQLLMKHIAERKGVKVDKCHDPETALAMADLDKYDAIFVDHVLSNSMNGTDLIRILSEKYPRLDIYLVTNFPKLALTESLKNLKIKGFIDKYDLAERMDEVLK